jgi:ABC-type multidrug transport system fused ATPase/permease subunit
MIPAIPVSKTFTQSKKQKVKERFAGKNIFRDTLNILSHSERKRFWLLASLDVIINCIDIFSLVLLLWIVQFYIQPQQTELLSFLPAWLTDKNSITFIGVFFFLFSTKNIVAFLIAKAQNIFIATVAVRISKNNLSGYQNAQFDEFVNVDSADHVRKIAYQPFDFCQYMLGGIQQIITQASLIFITITAIILFNVRIFVLLLLILLPPVVAVFYFIKKRLTKDKQQIKSSNQLSFQYLMDALKGYVEANIYDRNNFFLARFVTNRKKFSSHLFNSIALQTLPSRLIEIFAVMGLFILIVVAKWSGNNDTGTLITIGAFIAAAYKIIPGLVKIINVTSQIKAYEFSLSEIVGEKSELINDPPKLSSKIQSVQFSNVCFHYTGLNVLNDLSFEIRPGDFVGITGKSGKGKTTIFNLLLGFLSPHSGRILINEKKVDKEVIKSFWPSLSYVRQQSFFIHDTIARNITMEEESADKEQLQKVIKVSCLEELINNSPEGVHKIITENGKNISGGQQQRITLARALYKDADLILLDEPFNELDEASELLLLSNFKQLTDSGKMVLMITHNKKSLSFCNKIISLDDQ